MSGIQMALMGSSGRIPLDTQTVTVGVIGSILNLDRERGYSSAYPYGSIVDGTSNIYSGATISKIAWVEDGATAGNGSYVLYIPGVANSGWTSMVIGTQELFRVDASYSAGFWDWPDYNIATQQFGNTAGAVVPVYFY